MLRRQEASRRPARPSKRAAGKACALRTCVQAGPDTLRSTAGCTQLPGQPSSLQGPAHPPLSMPASSSGSAAPLRPCIPAAWPAPQSPFGRRSPCSCTAASPAKEGQGGGAGEAGRHWGCCVGVHRLQAAARARAKQLLTRAAAAAVAAASCSRGNGLPTKAVQSAARSRRCEPCRTHLFQARLAEEAEGACQV